MFGSAGMRIERLVVDLPVELLVWARA